LDHRAQSVRQLHAARAWANNADYSSDFPNLPGGIVNGVTSGWSDEDDLAFLPEDAAEGDSWRWAEQWIPHTGWFLLAVAASGR
jgi:hypothetical protein